MSLCLAPPGELAFLIDVIGPGTRAIAEAEALHVFGPLGNGFDLTVERPLIVAGGIGVAPMGYLSAALSAPRTILGFRSAWHAEAAALLPHAEIVVEPTYVTEAMPTDMDVLACGPEPMLEAVRALAPDAQLAWEAPMACGFGACYGCIVDGKRLCVEGPVLCEAA
jgi:NAD(P)H-flavin reductase